MLTEHQPRALINFAAESHVDRSIHGPGDFVQTNIVGTFHLLEAVRGYWDGLPGEAKAAFRFLHVSTDEVYGSLGPGAAAFTESHRYEPNIQIVHTLCAQLDELRPMTDGTSYLAKLLFL